HAERDGKFGSRRGGIGAWRGGEDKDIDSNDRLRREHRHGGALHRAAGLAAIRKDADNDDGRGQGERGADDRRDREGKTQRPTEAGEGKAAEDSLQRRETEHVVAPRADRAQGEVQADVKEKEDQTKLGEEAGGVAV